MPPSPSSSSPSSPPSPSLLLLLLCVTTASARCHNATFSQYGDKCYAASASVVPWEEMGETCSSLDADAVPVTIHSLMENSFLQVAKTVFMYLGVVDFMFCLYSLRDVFPGTHG